MVWGGSWGLKQGLPWRGDPRSVLLSSLKGPAFPQILLIILCVLSFWVDSL
jgi:hypothetical protein